MWKSIGAALIAVGLIALVVPQAYARSTDWIDGYELLRLRKALRKSGEMPVSIVCKDTNSKGLTYKSGVAKVEIRPNPGNVKWGLFIADEVPRYRSRLERGGFKRVSYSEYRRASGLRIPCAIWHKKI